jgi:CheY-like chemotaxis protein
MVRIWACSERVLAVQTPQTTHTVLLVDDVDTCRLAAKWFLGSFGYEVDCARSAEEALSRFDPGLHDVVVTDNSMPGMSGTEMAHVIKLRSPSTPIVMYSGTADLSCPAVDRFVERPSHLLVLKDAIEDLVIRPSESHQV